MRNIDDSIWRDEWFASQEIMGRLLWIGILSRVADDQGRFLDNADLIRSDVFPMDKISGDEIELWLTSYVQAGKVVRYIAGGKRLLQISNWWRYQASSSWMGKSKYLAPDGWRDFWRFHTVGHKIETSPNWSLRSALPSALLSKEVKEEVKEEEEDNATPLPTATAAKSSTSKPTQYFVDAGYLESNRVLLSAAGLSALPSNAAEKIDSVYAMIAAHGVETVQAALTDARIAWVKTPKKPGNGGGFYSVLNFGWVDWANEYLSTGAKRWDTAPSTMTAAPALVIDAHNTPVSF